MKPFLTFMALIISSSISSQQLVLKTPDAKKIQVQLEKDSANDEIYYYLLNNYTPISKQLEKKMNEWEKSRLCAFKQNFEYNINYAIDQCGEASGIQIEVVFPNIKRKAMMQWIEQISSVNPMSNTSNYVWKENNTKFEPKEAEAGCYYSITETGKNTIVNLYCGC